MRARGLKRLKSIYNEILKESRPMRARGLKPIKIRYVLERNKSRPMRARGLKRKDDILHPRRYGRAPCGRVD